MQSISMFEEKRESLGVKVIPTKGGSRIAKDSFGLKDSLENVAGQRKSLGADKLLHDIKEQPRIRRKSIGARKASIGKKVQETGRKSIARSRKSSKPLAPEKNKVGQAKNVVPKQRRTTRKRSKLASMLNESDIRMT